MDNFGEHEMNDVNLKIGACLVLMNEEDYIEYTLESIYKWADKIFILIGTPFEDTTGYIPDSTEEKVRNFPDPENKIFIQKETSIPMSGEQNEDACKMILLNKCRETGMDYCWIVDGDEVYEDKYMPALFDFARLHNPDLVSGWALEYWRGLRYCVGASKHFILFRVCNWLDIRIRCPKPKEGYKTMEAEISKEYFMFHHYNMVKTPERIQLKYSSTKIRGERGKRFDFESWMNNKFLAWGKNKNTPFLHPFRNDLWFVSVYVAEEVVPEIMKKHPWYKLDFVE
jgi:hypothetical protein